MLSASYQLSHTVTDTDGGTGYANFGRAVATHGNLALIASPGETTSITLDGGQSFVEIDTTSGKVSLVDTTTGNVLQTFDNPVPGHPVNTQFGASVTFVGDKIAIAAPGAVKVFVYDDYADDTPDKTYSFGIDPFTSYGASVAAYGDDLLVGASQANLVTGNGAILRYDLDSPSTTPINTYVNPDPGVSLFDQFGQNMVSDGTYIYSRAIVNGEAEVVAFDGAGSLVQVYHGLPGDFVFGTAMTTYQDPSAGNTVIISSPVASAAYQVDLSGNVVQTFLMPTNAGFPGVATSLAVSGGKLIAGDTGKYTDGGVDEFGNAILNQSGAVYVFDLASGSLDAQIENPNQGVIYNQDLSDFYDMFGAQVAATPAGGFIVSAPNANNANGIDAGTAYTYTLQITPTNSAPIASAGSPQTITEGQTATLDASGTVDNDGPGDIVSYSWDLNNDNVFGDATGVTTSFTPDLSGSYTVNVQATDTAGHTSIASTTVGVTDIAPTSNAGGNQTVTTGSVVSFTGSGTSAPGDEIALAWDFNYSGNPLTFNVNATGANASTSYATPGTRTVALRVTDDDGQVSISTLTVTVNNAPPVNQAPVAALTGQTAAVRLQNVSFNGSFTDSDAGDTHTVAWNFGDGNTIAAHSTTDAGALATSHVYTASGTYTVTMTIKDAAGATSTKTLSVVVGATGVQGGVLYVGGSNGSDNVTITRNGSNNSVNIGSTTTNYTGGKVVVYLGDGNDTLLIANNVTMTVEAHGGNGTDILTGGGGPSILIGDAGSDLLTGGGGRDLLIGGTGADIILGNTDDDILIAGSTSHDNVSSDLTTIMNEWNSSHTYTVRVNNLRAVAGFLTPDQDVFDDGAVDILVGGNGTDWFVFNNDGGVRDLIADRVNAEIQTDIDVLMT